MGLLFFYSRKLSKQLCWPPKLPTTTSVMFSTLYVSQEPQVINCILQYIFFPHMWYFVTYEKSVGTPTLLNVRACKILHHIMIPPVMATLISLAHRFTSCCGIGAMQRLPRIQETVAKHNVELICTWRF